MKAIALGLLLLLVGSGCSRHQLNQVSVLSYDRDDAAPEVVGKSLVNVGPWVVVGAVHAFFAIASVAPEAVVSMVNGALP